MTQQRELFEQYEDAFFALLMDRVAQEEGRKAVVRNKELQEDPEAAVSEVLQKRCMQTIRKAFSAKLRRKTGRVFGKGIHVTAILVLLLAAMLTISCAAFPSLRANFFNMVLTTFDTHTDFSFTTEEAEGVDPLLEIVPGWMPSGFDIVEDDWIERCAWKTYLNNNTGASVRIEKLYPITVGADTEDARIESTAIQGYSAKMIIKDHEIRIIWLNTDEDIVNIVFAEWISIEDAIKIAENVR